MNNSKRNFVRKTIVGTTAFSVGGVLPGFNAKSYARIMGANNKIIVSMMGVNSRGKALAKNFSVQKNCEIAHICDVDSRAVAACQDAIKERQTAVPKAFSDFRLSLESKDIDAMVIAAPDHWHAPASLLAMQAGKHVYVEKPCSHNPREGEILVEAAARYKKVIQMGNQRRSWPNVVKAIQELKEGVLGRVYFGKGWYVNNRGSIGTGKAVEVPSWINWDLWQGPAPRKEYRDNYLHYNWHWFWNWGTGEALNNGTHMIDLLRWGMDVDFPVRVSSNGGRFRYKDDWETPDTQVINLDFDKGVSMSWEGRSCNGKQVEGSTVGVMFYGEKGSLMIPFGNSYTIFDLEGKMVKEVKEDYKNDPHDLSNPSERIDALHIQNMFDGIIKGSSLHSDVESGFKSTLLVQLGNISQRVGRSLRIDPANGHILDDHEATAFWSRNYEKGWEMKL
jgi:predicted dehydrogenase